MSDLTVKNLNIAYGEKVIFKDFSITFKENNVSVILGGSGVGKTTLLNAIAGLLPFEGVIDKGDAEVSYIFQNDRLIPAISVFKNLDLILRAIIKNKKERKAKIDNMLKRLEIYDVKDKLPPSLSGGQAQRVAMARAYLYPAKLLLLDEPFKALDTALKDRLIKQLISLNEAYPRTIIFVTHAIDECLLLADQYFVFGGNPIDISLSGSVVGDKNVRRLDDAGLAEVRATLLKEVMKF